jgi:diguanylate cyclase (GGDEF)-like protein
VSESESSRPEGDISRGYPDALNQIYSGVIVVNPSGMVEFANDAFCELFSISEGRDSIQGKPAGEVLNVFMESYRDPELGLARVKEIVALGQPVRGEEIPIKNGRTYLRDFYPMSFLGVRGGRVWHHTDVTALKQAEERIARLLDEKRILISELEEKNQRLEGLASTDLLTGLANRRHFDEVVQAEMHRSSRHGQPLSLMMLDIDHFKRVNDTFGHSIGDRVLQQVADCTRGAVRPYDCLARWGGEEFIILMPNTSLASAAILAERIRESIAAMTTDPVGQVTASLGVAEYLPPSTLGPWLDRADQALYRAKREGRNRVEVALQNNS